MAAQTQAQWLAKIRGWVPGWWFEEERLNVALFDSIAGIFAQLDAEIDNHVRETFIAQSTVPVLDTHGDERSVERIPTEPDASYANRIRSYVNQADIISIKSLVDSLLIVGECEIREGYVDLAFADRGCYLSRDQFFTLYHYDYFRIIIEQQKKIPLSFNDRGFFLDREAFAGGVNDVNPVYDTIVAAVNKAKALGVLYSIVER